MSAARGGQCGPPARGAGRGMPRGTTTERAEKDPLPAKPFIKWAGGKTQLLDQFEPLYPPASSIKRYIEPFVGSGAVYFHVREILGLDTCILADGNADLINVYRVIQQDVAGLVRALARHRRAHSEEHYYKVRAQSPGALTDVSRAARLIYLNKTCFNGLYRVNSRGEFNVPMGRYVNPRILDEPNLRAVGAALRKVTLKVAHFREILSDARRGDFVYLDPPYHPISKTSSFTSYAVNGDRSTFGGEDQAELAEIYRKLAAKGCLVMLSNSDTAFVRRLYRDQPGVAIRTVSARRSINSRSDRRGRIREIVVLNYEPSGNESPLKQLFEEDRPARPGVFQA